MYRFVLRRSSKNLLQKKFYHNKSHRNEVLLEAGFGKFLVILAPFAAAGGAIAYAKYDNEFRKTLVKNVPGAESVLNLFLEEKKPFEGLSKNLDGAISSVTGLFGGGEQKASEKKPTTETKKPPTPAPAPSPSPSSASTVSAPKAEPSKAEKKLEVATAAAPVSLPKPQEKLPTEVTELEKAVELAAGLAYQEYNKAIKILNTYNEDIAKVVDQAIEKVDPSAWVVLRNKTGARDSAVEAAENAGREALSKIDKYSMALSNIAPNISFERLEALRIKIKNVSDHISNIKDELYRAKDTARLSERYWKKVETARNYFVDEIESIFPGLNLSEKKLNLSKDDLDLFILHAFSHVLAYQKELQRLQLEGDHRLKRAVEMLRGDDTNEAVRAQLEHHLERERSNLALENQKKIFQIRAEAERELRKQLKRQAEAHVDHIQDAIAQKEVELRRTFGKEMDEKISSEKASYKLQLATMLGKLKGMDAALKARAESERCAHQAQALWAACQALWASVRNGEPGVHWQEKLRPLSSEIKAVSKAAADGDELVSVVIKNLPKEAQVRGVYPEDALRERFLNVEKSARRLALVPEKGASLPMYLLSYIQSFLILRPDEPISEDELQDKPIDFSKLDTYDILNRARYFLDRGDLMLTVKYLNLLQGAPRKIAKDWMHEALLLLETQQAANTLMAHAAASGLLYL